MQEERLDRIIQVSKSVIDDIRSGTRLSDILPQARFIAEVNDDNVEAAWIEYEIHGRERAPLSSSMELSEEQLEKAKQIYRELHSVIDTDKLRETIESRNKSSPFFLHQVSDSVITLESCAISGHPEMRTHIYKQGSVQDKIKMTLALESERLLTTIRAAVHKYASGVWLKAVKEKESLALLGPDYKIVIENLEALKSGVGQILQAAIDNLRKENPENWSLAALACRNVIIRLGDLLWRAPHKIYLSELDGKELNITGEKEKNKLYAYIDYHYKHIEEEEKKDSLKYIHDKLWRIYEIGSKGKRTVRYKEAQEIVVDTFEFVAQLDEITGLKPINEI